MGDFFSLLTGSRLRLFKHLCEAAPAGASVGEIAVATGLKVGSVRTAVRSMAYVGLVDRHSGAVSSAGRTPDLLYVREPVRRWWAITKETFMEAARVEVPR